jgi:S-adenosylmethionine hydrolase
MARPILAWLTDFGLTDTYVGVMKAVALTLAPDATCVDLTHDISPQDVRAGALALLDSYRFFPSGTIFVAVVDPGVGTERAALAIEAGGHVFLGPDNGLLSLAVRAAGPTRAVTIDNPAVLRPTVSRTFEGRDRFAPAAGWLARGGGLSELGPSTATWKNVHLPSVQRVPQGLEGEVLAVDRFGNAMTNISSADLQGLPGDVADWRVLVGDHSIPLVETYGACAPQTACALVGSADRLEIAISGGDAASRLGLRGGSSVVLTVPALLSGAVGRPE